MTSVYLLSIQVITLILNNVLAVILLNDVMAVVNYSLGSVLNHVLLHQTIIGFEAQKQMEMAGDYPDIIIGCIGGGSNFAGMFLPFLKDKIDGKKKDLRIINVEPTSCPTVTKGLYAYD